MADIKLVNEDGVIVAKDTDTGETIPIEFDESVHQSASAGDVSVANALGIPVYSDDANAPNETHFFNDSDGSLKYKDSSGTVHAGGGGLQGGDNFDGQGTSDFSNLNSISTDKLNNADLENAAPDTVPAAQGDGTLAMKEVGTDYSWTKVHEFDERVDAGSSVTFSDDIGGHDEYRLRFMTAVTDRTTRMFVRLNGDTDTDQVYEYTEIRDGTLNLVTGATEWELFTGRTQANITGEYTIPNASRNATIYGNAGVRGDTEHSHLVNGSRAGGETITEIEVIADTGDLALDADSQYKIEIFGRGGTGN